MGASESRRVKECEQARASTLDILKVDEVERRVSGESFPTEHPFARRQPRPSLSSPFGPFVRASAKGSIYRKAACGCAARCVSDVICGCHGDAIDWPTRRQTSRESRRHSDYCPSPAPRPAKPTEGATPLPLPPAVLFILGATLVRLNVLAHDAICLHVCISSPIHTLAFTHSLAYTYTRVCLTVPRTPFDNLNSCVGDRGDSL